MSLRLKYRRGGCEASAVVSPELGKPTRSIIALASPVAASRFGIFLLTIVETALVGQTGVGPLGVYALAVALPTSLSVIGLGLLAGLPARVATALVKESPQSPWLGAGIALSLVVAGVFTIPLCYGETLLLAAWQPPRLAREAGNVMLAFAPGMLPLLIFQAMALFMEASGRARVPMVVVGFANVMNLLLTGALVLGVPGLTEPLGPLGAAIGWSAVRWLMAAIILLFYFAASPSASFQSHRFGCGHLSGLLMVGAPVALATGFEVGAFLTLAGMAGSLGPDAMAGYQIARNFYQIPYTLASALGLSTGIRIADALPRGGWLSGRHVMQTGFRLQLLFSLAVAIPVTLFPIELGSIFTSNQAFLELIRPSLYLAAIIIVLDGLQGFLIHALRGVLDGLVPSAIQLVAFWALAIPASGMLAFTFNLDLFGILAGLALGLGAASGLLTLRALLHPALRSPVRTSNC